MDILLFVLIVSPSSWAFISSVNTYQHEIESTWIPRIKVNACYMDVHTLIPVFLENYIPTLYSIVLSKQLADWIQLAKGQYSKELSTLEVIIGH